MNSSGGKLLNFDSFYFTVELRLPKESSLIQFIAIFCSFSSPYFVLSSSLHIATYCDYADDLLYLFGQNWARLYGIDMVVYNVHALFI